jgi:hypothetical protein
MSSRKFRCTSGYEGKTWKFRVCTAHENSTGTFGVYGYESWICLYWPSDGGYIQCAETMPRSMWHLWGGNTARSLAHHQCDQHGISFPLAENQTPPHLDNLPGTHYLVRIPTHENSASCPVPGCSATVTSRYGMRWHFQHCHVKK